MMHQELLFKGVVTYHYAYLEAALLPILHMYIMFFTDSIVEDMHTDICEFHPCL